MLGSIPSRPGGSRPQLGVVAAGHPTTAQTGAAVLRQGGNAVDAAIAAMLASFACEPLLNALGAGGYMLVVEPGQRPVLLDFFVEAPGRGADPAKRAELVPISVSFGDAVQVFNIGAASVGTYGLPLEPDGGLATVPEGAAAPELKLAPAAALARDGVRLNPQQAYVVEILAGIVTSTPESSALFAPEGSSSPPATSSASRSSPTRSSCSGPRARHRSTRAKSPRRSCGGSRIGAAC